MKNPTICAFAFLLVGCAASTPTPPVPAPEALPAGSTSHLVCLSFTDSAFCVRTVGTGSERKIELIQK